MARKTTSSSHIVRACTTARRFFPFDPDQEEDLQGQEEAFSDYALRICKKYGFLALDEAKSSATTIWMDDYDYGS